MNLATIKKESSVTATFDKINRRIKKNETLAGYYEDLAEEFPAPPWTKKAEYFSREERLHETCISRGRRMRNCCKFWLLDYYRLQGVKDVLKTSRCEDIFCDCCGSAAAKQREEKFAPFLDALSEKFDIYHIVFTIPNIEGEELQPAVQNMYNNFAYIVRLFSGNAKIKGVDFLQFGYVGAVRALEITKSKVYGNFHPHFHCLFIFKKGVKLKEGKKHVNAYSFNNPDIRRSHRKKPDYGEPERYFSEFEILLQKIWRLRIDGVKVTKDNINALPLGYSVIADNACGHYHEVFKYATKGIFKGEEGLANNYFDFKATFYTLYKRHIIQGYGVLRGFDFEDAAKLEADERYNKVIETLQTLETPERISEYLEQINENIKREQTNNIVYISRASINDLAAGE